MRFSDFQRKTQELTAQEHEEDKASPTDISKTYSISDDANIAFIQALGTTMAQWNQVPLDDRHGLTLVELFNSLLDQIVDAVTGESDDVRDEVHRMRNLLYAAIRQELNSG